MRAIGYGPGRHRRTREAWAAMARELAQAEELITDLIAERDALLRVTAAAEENEDAQADGQVRTLMEQFWEGVRAARQALSE